jgi:hypothetical protein
LFLSENSLNRFFYSIFWGFDHTPVQEKYHKLIGDTIDQDMKEMLATSAMTANVNLGLFGGMILSKLNTGVHDPSISFPNNDSSRVESSEFPMCFADLSHVIYNEYKTTKFHIECVKARYCPPSLLGIMLERADDLGSPIMKFDWMLHPCVPKVSS